MAAASADRPRLWDVQQQQPARGEVCIQLSQPDFGGLSDIDPQENTGFISDSIGLDRKKLLTIDQSATVQQTADSRCPRTLVFDGFSRTPLFAEVTLVTGFDKLADHVSVFP